MVRFLAVLVLALVLALLGVLRLPSETSGPTAPTSGGPALHEHEAASPLEPLRISSERVQAETPGSAGSELLEGAIAAAAGAKWFLVRVQDPGGSPIPGAQVRLVGLEAGIEATSDTEGSCRLPWPPPGTRAELAVSAEGCFPHHQQRITEEMRITLRPLAHLSGRVLDRQSRAPVEGASLRVIWGRQGESVQTDGAGCFAGLAVPQGTGFPLSVQARAYQQVTIPLILRAGEAPAAHDVLLERASVARFVVMDFASGEPLGGAILQARGATYTSDGEGFVEVDRSFRPSDETHWVSVRASGHCATDFELTHLDSQVAPIVLRLPRSCRIEGIVLDAGGAVLRGARVTASFDPKALEGRDGDGWRWSPIRYLGWPSNAWLDLSLCDRQRESTDESGQFAFDGFPAGLPSVRLEVQSGNTVLACREVGPLDAPGSTVRVEIRLDPPSGATIRGQLLLNGQPTAGRVRWQGAMLEGSGEVSADGRYELADVEAGAVMLIGLPQTREMSFSGNVRAERQVRVGRAAQVECDLVAELPMSSIRGRVSGPGGEPIAGAEIRLRGPTGSFASTSAEDGTWTAQVPESAEELRVSTQLVTREGELVARAGDRGVDFHVARTALLRYRAQAAGSGVPIDNPRLEWRVDDARFVTVGSLIRTPPDANGWRQVELPEGQHELFATVSGGAYQSAARTVHLVVGSATEVVFELEPAYAVKLRLADGEGSTPARHSVALVREEDWQRVHAELDGDRIRWNWDGAVESPGAHRTFTLEQLRDLHLGGLAPGRYRLKVFPEDILLDPDVIELPAGSGSIELRWRALR